MHKKSQTLLDIYLCSLNTRGRKCFQAISFSAMIHVLLLLNVTTKFYTSLPKITPNSSCYYYTLWSMRSASSGGGKIGLRSSSNKSLYWGAADSELPAPRAIGASRGRSSPSSSTTQCKGEYRMC